MPNTLDALQKGLIVDVKEAAKVALTYVADLFAEEQIGDLGLEEVQRDSRNEDWLITVGFSRPWERSAGALAALGGGVRPRSYKVLRIDASTGSVKSLTDRET